MRQDELQEGVYREGKLLFTENLAKGCRHFQETIVHENNREYRQWDARSSKMASAMIKGMKCPVKKNTKILYLGASHGYTVSYISDIAKDGFIFAVEFAPRVFRDFTFMAEKRKNVAPILDDANKPETYYHYLMPVDIVYQDIAQKNQVEIFLKNVNLFLKKDGLAFIALKARSIDTTKEPRKIYNEVRAELSQHLKVLEQRTLEPFQRDHCMFICKTK